MTTGVCSWVRSHRNITVEHLIYLDSDLDSFHYVVEEGTGAKETGVADPGLIGRVHVAVDHNCDYLLVDLRDGGAGVPDCIALEISQASILVDSVSCSLTDDCLLAVAGVAVVVLALGLIVSAVLVVAVDDAGLEADGRWHSALAGQCRTYYAHGQ